MAHCVTVHVDVGLGSAVSETSVTHVVAVHGVSRGRRGAGVTVAAESGVVVIVTQYVEWDVVARNSGPDQTGFGESEYYD